MPIIVPIPLGDIIVNLSPILKFKLKLIFFDPFDYFCENLKCKQVIDGNLLYSDDQHLSAFGSNYLIKKIEQNIMQNLVF